MGRTCKKWAFLNINKRRQMKCRGDMDEFFFGSRNQDVADLIRCLQVPYGLSLAEHRAMDPNSWAGDRIVCINEDTTDWPPGILAAAQTRSGSYGNLSNLRNIETPKFLFKHAYNLREFTQYQEYIRCPGVLRNLSKKIYVLANGLPSLSDDSEPFNYKLEYLEFPYWPSIVATKPGLGTVLLSRIGWTEDGYNTWMTWEDSEELTEGDWAGDRFDVRALDDVKEELERDGWTDATEEEAERITDIWESDFDPPLTCSEREYYLKKSTKEKKHYKVAKKQLVSSRGKLSRDLAGGPWPIPPE